IAGANDDKYRDIAERLVSEIGENAQLSIVANSGHTPHLEQPDDFLNQVTEFLSSVK
ncbi:MAG: 2-succinyl-6-hydroxy-2,4-cyclohexadiene-1-carboxylate synthase, partial [Actinobacteria bacterium]|nr:2-succinyl-6-hydroxy-2,4-cyclohexadiene-1-carboxylate synthase [Actinomycetota bacterium]